jgi:hypothetical protein
MLVDPSGLRGDVPASVWEDLVKNPAAVWLTGWEETCDADGGFQRLIDWFSLLQWGFEDMELFGKGVVGGSYGSVWYLNFYRIQAGKGESLAFKWLSKAFLVASIEATIFDVVCWPFDDV